METKARRPKRVNQDDLVSRWRNVTPGSPVEFQKTKTSEWQKTKTASEPFLLGGHTASIMLEGVSGSFSLEFVRLP